MTNKQVIVYYTWRIFCKKTKEFLSQNGSL